MSRIAVTHYRIGIKSKAGNPILYSAEYATIEAAREAKAAFHPGHFIFRVTTEEVK